MLSLDLTRDSFRPKQNYTKLRQQSGRVALESEFNEAIDIIGEQLRRTIKDVICDSGSPDDGFKISALQSPSNVYDFAISKGTYYIGGLRFDCSKDTTFLSQPDWLQISTNPDLPALNVMEERNDFVYLECWEQDVSAVEDAELPDKAIHLSLIHI